MKYDLAHWFLGALLTFGVCGLFGVFIDSDHFIRCLPALSQECITGWGPRYFHGYLGLGLSVYFGVVYALVLGQFLRVVDQPPEHATQYHKVRK